MKVLRWIYDNSLFLITLFLLAFIPLYPKKPLVDVVNTWVYVRLEDFIVVVVLFFWVFLLVRKKITLKTPLTMPILLFWIVGALATIHGVLLIFPEIANVFPNVALLSFLRRIEYISLFFIAFAGMKDKRLLPWVVAAVVITLLAVSAYGFGQKYLGFPAYLTMNEEFAKGQAIQLSALSRVPSTFAGHYDLAAYLVLIIPLVVSLVFGVRNWLIKLILLGASGVGFILLFMTVSRVSFLVLFVALAIVLFFHKRKWVFVALPAVGILLAILLINFTPRVLERFNNTVKEIDVLVDAQTGEAIGNVKPFSLSEFEDKTFRQRSYRNNEDINAEIKADSLEASPSALIPFEEVPASGVLLVPPNESTGENLPQGTGYINLSLSPVTQQRDEFFYEIPSSKATSSAEVQMFSGRFLVKKALAYDLSFTTRYQGEWPHAIEAFKRNIFFGSGYSSISLAIDNSYLRMLGEVGFLGFITFFIIFVTAAAYIKQNFSYIDSPLARSFVIGFIAGVVGIILNATLIDVFEASKVAFTLWLLMGVTIGLVAMYQTRPFALYEVLKKVGTSSYAIMVYLIVLTLFVFFPMIGNYFVGDDFTWFRWVSQSGDTLQKIIAYFTQADGFFYRPGTKIYFLTMYSFFWLNPVSYHIVSLVLHCIVVLLVFLLAKKVLPNLKLATLAAFLFVMLSSYHEAVFWISSVGHLFSTMFVLASLLLFIKWDETKKVWYLGVSLLAIVFSLLFHELGVIAPLLMLLYKFANSGFLVTSLKLKKSFYALLFSPVILYLIVRFLSQSHWSGGDYSYNLLKLPFNVIGNTVGYFMLSLFGPLSLSIYDTLRSLTRENLLIAFGAVIILIGGAIFVYPLCKRFEKETKRIVLFSLLFSFIALLPFLGLGNITSRYSYLSSVGFVILFAFLASKLYDYLKANGRDIAGAVVTLLFGIFFLLHIIQVQQIHGDWHEAGLKVNRFFVGVESIYNNYWSTEPITLNLVNVPIRSGEAWVFPVGLDDALWFTFKNPQIKIKQWNSVEEALDSVTNPRNEKVLLFDGSGTVTEQKRVVKQ